MRHAAPCTPCMARSTAAEMSRGVHTQTYTCVGTAADHPAGSISTAHTMWGVDRPRRCARQTARLVSKGMQCGESQLGVMMGAVEHYWLQAIKARPQPGSCRSRRRCSRPGWRDARHRRASAPGGTNPWRSASRPDPANGIRPEQRAMCILWSTNAAAASPRCMFSGECHGRPPGESDRCQPRSSPCPCNMTNCREPRSSAFSTQAPCSDTYETFNPSCGPTPLSVAGSSAAQC